MNPDISLVAFDFSTKAEHAIRTDEVACYRERGLFVWAEVDGSACAGTAGDGEACRAVMEALGVSEEVQMEVLGPDEDGRHDVHEDCLHFAVTESSIVEQRLMTSHVDMVLGVGFLFVYRRKPARFLREMRKTYRKDFEKFAKSSGFLLYEIGDHLIKSYRQTLHKFQESVEEVQLRLFSNVDDAIFRSVADLTQDILTFRKVVLSSRELLHELGSRKSPFVSDTTQPALEQMSGTLGRLGDDLATEREVLSETLNLYMGMVSHRTNKVVNRLTVISVIFLPLSFLCGVYGVNLRGSPEVEWAYGYWYFWGLCLVIAGWLLIYMKRKRWL
jgi:magnesium transporter